MFSNFLYEYAVDDDMTKSSYLRDSEVDNLVHLMNLLYDQALCSWKPLAGKNDASQLRLRRLFGSKPMMAWAELLRDAICARLDLTDREDQARPLYREVSAEQWKRIDALTREILSLRDEVQGMSQRSAPEKPPPHY